MNRSLFRCLLLASVFASAASVADNAPPANPYAIQRHREIKALSAEEMDGYLAGSGLGLSRAAELNGYPGPRHVLEFASQLGLREEQRQAVLALIGPMQQQARHEGAQLVDADRELDQLFAGGHAEPEKIRVVLERIYDALSHVRDAHLQAHLATRQLLTDTQIAQYNVLRGYGNDHHGHLTTP